MANVRKPMQFSVDTLGNEAKRSPVVPLAPLREERQQVGARISAGAYRRLKLLAVARGEPVQSLIEQAIVEYLERAAE